MPCSVIFFNDIRNFFKTKTLDFLKKKIFSSHLIPSSKFLFLGMARRSSIKFSNGCLVLSANILLSLHLIPIVVFRNKKECMAWYLINRCALVVSTASAWCQKLLSFFSISVYIRVMSRGLYKREFLVIIRENLC